MAEAALRRQNSAPGGMSRGMVEQMEQDREKMDLIGKICEQLRVLKVDEPFGLRMMEPAKLRMYSKHLQERISGGASKS